MTIATVNKEIESIVTFLFLHIKLIFKPQELVKYILNESLKKLFIKSILLIIMNYFVFKLVFIILNTDKIGNYVQLPLLIVSLSVIYSICFLFIFFALKITLKERFKLAVFSSVFIYNTILPIQIIILIFFLVTESYFFYFFLLAVCLISTCFIFIIYPLCFNRKFPLVISIFLSYVLFCLINGSSYFLLKDKVAHGISDPIFHEFVETNKQYIETAKYIINNSILFNNFMREFSDGYNYSYDEMIKSQLLTVINKKNEVEVLLSTTQFSRNKRSLILTLESIEIYEKILFEFNRLIVSLDKEYINNLEKTLKERQILINNAQDKLEMLNERIDEHKKAGLDPTPDIIDEIEKMSNEIKQITADGADIKIITANMAINNAAMKEINALVKKLIVVTDKLIGESEKGINYFEWRTKIPF